MCPKSYIFLAKNIHKEIDVAYSWHNHMIYNDHIRLCYALYGGYTVKKKDNRKYKGFSLSNATSDRTRFKIPPFIMSWVSSLMFRECWNWHQLLDMVFKRTSWLFQNAKWGCTSFLRLKGIYFPSWSMIVRVHDVCLFNEQHLEVNVMLVVRCCH